MNIGTTDSISMFTGIATMMMAAATFYGYRKIKKQTEEIAKQREEMNKQTKQMIDQNKKSEQQFTEMISQTTQMKQQRALMNEQLLEMQKQREQSLLLIQKNNAINQVEKFGELLIHDLNYIISAYEDTKYLKTVYSLIPRDDLHFTYKELKKISKSSADERTLMDYPAFLNHTPDEKLTFIKNVARYKTNKSAFDSDTSELINELIFHNWDLTDLESNIIDPSKPEETDEEEKEKILRKLKLRNELPVQFIHELEETELNVIGDLEEISMYYNYELVDKKSLYDSIGVNFMFAVIILYPVICKVNKDVLNMYPNTVKLYQEWHPGLVNKVLINLEEDE